MLNKEKATNLLKLLQKDLPGSKEKDVINEIFYNKCDSIDKILFSNKGYKDYIERLKELYDVLENSKVNKSILKIVDDYIDLSSFNIDRAKISRIESGDRIIPDYEVLLFAKALKVSILDFYKGSL